MMVSCIISAGGMPSDVALEACKPEVTKKVLKAVEDGYEYLPASVPSPSKRGKGGKAKKKQAPKVPKCFDALGNPIGDGDLLWVYWPRDKQFYTGMRCTAPYIKKDVRIPSLFLTMSSPRRFF